MESGAFVGWQFLIFPEVMSFHCGFMDGYCDSCSVLPSWVSNSCISFPYGSVGLAHQFVLHFLVRWGEWTSGRLFLTCALYLSLFPGLPCNLLLCFLVRLLDLWSFAIPLVRCYNYSFPNTGLASMFL